MNLMMLLEMAAASMGEREALVCEGERWTHAQLFAGAGRAAAKVRAAGVERVALLDVSSPAVPLALFASAWAGKPFVPLNYRLSGPELDALIERVKPALLITDRERVAQLAGREGVRVMLREELLAAARESLPPPEADWSMEPEDVAIWLFTSGTTGAPKAALLRHRHLVSYILGSVEFMSADESDAALVSVPPYHVAGITNLLTNLYLGRRIVYLGQFDAAGWVRAVREHAITHAMVVPTMLARIGQVLEASGAGLPSLRAISYGGARTPATVLQQVMRLLPDVDLTNAYGLTETSSTIAVLGPADHRAARDGDPAALARLASAGTVLPTVEVQVRGPEGE
ncbi:MAG: AMP-binding protein, partial [Myxococcota bacterium]